MSKKELRRGLVKYCGVSRFKVGRMIRRIRSLRREYLIVKIVDAKRRSRGASPLELEIHGAPMEFNEAQMVLIRELWERSAAMGIMTTDFDGFVHWLKSVPDVLAERHKAISVEKIKIS